MSLSDFTFRQDTTLDFLKAFLQTDSFAYNYLIIILPAIKSTLFYESLLPGIYNFPLTSYGTENETGSLYNEAINSSEILISIIGLLCLVLMYVQRD